MEVEEVSMCGHLPYCPCQAQCQLISGCLPFLHSLQPVCLPCYSPSSPSHPLHNITHSPIMFLWLYILFIIASYSHDFQSKWCELSHHHNVMFFLITHFLTNTVIFNSIYPFLFSHASELSFLSFAPFWNPLHDSLILKPSWTPPPCLQHPPVHVLCACCASLALQQCEQRPQ